MDKEDFVYAYTHTDWNTTHFKNAIRRFAAAWMDLEINILSEIRERQRHLTCDITHMWNLQGMDQRNRNRLTDIENKLVGAKGEGRIGSLG